MGLAHKSFAAAICVALSALPSLALSTPLDDIVNKVKSDFSAINAKGEQDRAAIRAQQQNGANPNDIAQMAQNDGGGEQTIPLTIPKDKKIGAAVEEALPTIKKIVSIHQCLKHNSGLREMNFFAVPGMDMTQFGSRFNATIGLPIMRMKFHDKNKCPRVQVVDQFSMPALNALLFRTVYFADDSGETSSFLYLFMKTDDGSWKIKQLEQVNQ